MKKRNKEDDQGEKVEKGTPGSKEEGASKNDGVGRRNKKRKSIEEDMNSDMDVVSKGIDGQSKSSEDLNKTESCKGNLKGPAEEVRRLCLEKDDAEYPKGTYAARYGLLFECPLKNSVSSLMEVGSMILRKQYKNPLNMNRTAWFLGNTLQQWLLDVGELARKRFDETFANQVMDKASVLASRSAEHDDNSYKEIVERCKALELTMSSDGQYFGRNRAKEFQATEKGQSSEDEEEEEIAVEDQMRTHMKALEQKLAWVKGLTVDKKFQKLQHKTLQQDECKESMKFFLHRWTNTTKMRRRLDK